VTIELIHGDCLVELQKLAENSVDLTVTSPPYDNLRTYGKDFDTDAFDWHAIIKELYRVTKPRGVVVWVVADAMINGSETGTSFKQALWAMECGFNNETMIYQQTGTGAKGSNYYYWQAFEFMFVWAKDGNPKASHRITDIRNSEAGRLRRLGKKNKVIGSRTERRVRGPEWSVRPNVWRITSTGSDITEHPAQFPETLVHDHIVSWSNPGDVVLDPMMGSGTTGKEAVKLTRNFIGIEIDRGYFEIAQRRIAEAQLQPRLPMIAAEQTAAPEQLALDVG